MNILLDYVFNVTSVIPTSAANTGFLKQACLVVKPKGEVTTGVITECTSNSAIAALTDNVEGQQLLSAGMSKVFVLPMDDLDLSDALEGHENDFYTVIISSDFVDAEIKGSGSIEVTEVKASLKIQDITYTAKATGEDGNDITVIYNDTKEDGSAEASVISNAISIAMESGVTTAEAIEAAIVAFPAAYALVNVVVDLGHENDTQTFFTPAVNLEGGVDAESIPATQALDVGEFEGVVGTYSQVEATAKEYAAIEKRVGFFGNGTNKAKNMCFAFGSLLSNALNWLNQQYITMPLNDGVATLGDSETMFDDKVSFVMSDTQYSNRLALFACGGKAIVAPYITKNLSIDLQSAALSFISGNQPTYTKKYAALLENSLKDVIQSYVDRLWIEDGTVSVSLVEENFVASSSINISEPKAMWRVFAQMNQTL
jgi:hypothetical protein